jgi:hypothetical protein
MLTENHHEHGHDDRQHDAEDGVDRSTRGILGRADLVRLPNEPIVCGNRHERFAGLCRRDRPGTSIEDFKEHLVHWLFRYVAGRSAVSS